MDLGPGLNYFYGPNGAGKTAILEAVHLLCRGRSFRTQRVQSLIQNDAPMLVVRAQAEDELTGPVTLAMSKDRRSRTELKINGQSERRLSEAARLTPLQVMLPDVSDLVFGSPGTRRQWLDWGAFHVKPDYLAMLREYLRVLKQRNAALKELKSPFEPDPWTLRLVELAECVTARRRTYLAALKPHFHRNLHFLAPELDVSIGLQRGWPESESLEKLLGESVVREVKSGATQWGAHRADVVLRVGGSRASAVLSRGQGKMVASVMKIAQASLLSESMHRLTMFLIDDAGAELDDAHNARFFGLLDELGCQILATTTAKPDAGPAGTPIESSSTDSGSAKVKMFHVKRGAIEGA